ncbi:MAG: TIGR00730 family Rossman fold protein [Phycisphaerales bacterium]|jgi:hypothetical protein|nr:TIGR00730 family Rossman fold protein [Phycisphaerales bacterium]
MERITVYCSSSTRASRHLHDAAEAVGRALAAHGVTVVYGGGSIGLMGALAQGCKAEGGRLIGVTTNRLVELEQASCDCDELEVYDTMRQRRKRLLELANGVLVLPGGLGTLEEFFEALVGRQLAEHGAPIGLVNVNGALNSLLLMIDDLVHHRFVRASARDLFFVEEDGVAAVKRLLRTPGGLVDPTRMVPSGPD